MTTRSYATFLRLAVVPGVVGIGSILLTSSAPQAQSLNRARSIAVVGEAARQWERQLEDLQRAGTVRLVSSREDSMLQGRVHDRYDQYIGDARVFGGQLVRQRSADGTQSVFGQVYLDASLPTTTPALTPEQAVARATAIAGRAPLAAHRPELVVLPREDGSFRLTWYLRVFTGKDLVALFLDASSGEEVFRYSDLQTQSAAVGTGTGVLGDRKKVSARQSGGAFVADDALRPPSLVTYDLKGDVDRVNRALDGLTTLGQADIASDADNDWTDGANVDGHVYVGFTYDYYFKRFERRGLDGNNTRIRSIVHPARRDRILEYDDETVGTFLLNAFWCGECGGDGLGFMMFGEGLPPNFYLSGSGQTVNYFSGGLDIVAHELTHGVTDYSSGLIYMNESGALNEAFSDMMGVSADFFTVALGAKQAAANYIVGDEIFTPFLAGSTSGIRSMSDPRAFGDPDHYSIRFRGSEDNGGVHINSGIANNAFYLAIEGGTNRTSGISVQGVGGANREQIERVFYRAFTQLLPSNATFSIARQATLRAATDLYGGSSAAFRAVEQAWNAVGVQ